MLRGITESYLEATININLKYEDDWMRSFTSLNGPSLITLFRKHWECKSYSIFHVLSKHVKYFFVLTLQRSL